MRSFTNAPHRVVARAGTVVRAANVLLMTVVAMASTKGGVGKTVLSFELAAALDAVLVDLDWHAGGATRMWGFRPLSRARVPLLDALDRGPTASAPRPRSAD